MEHYFDGWWRRVAGWDGLSAKAKDRIQRSLSFPVQPPYAKQKRELLFHSALQTLDRDDDPAAEWMIVLAGSNEARGVPSPAKLLLRACKSGNLSLVERLCRNGIDLSVQARTGTTPLIAAVQANSLEVVRYLLSQGANANTADRSGSSPLHWGVLCDRAEIVRSLLDHDADVNATNHVERTPISIAVGLMSPSMTETIYEYYPAYCQSCTEKVCRTFKVNSPATAWPPAIPLLNHGSCPSCHETSGIAPELIAWHAPGLCSPQFLGLLVLGEPVFWLRLCHSREEGIEAAEHGWGMPFRPSLGASHD